MHDVNIPGFGEYLYRVMVSATEEQKMNIDPALLRYFKDERTIHRFCANQTFSKQLLVFTGLGYDWTLHFAPNSDIIDTTLCTIIDQFRYPDKRLDVVEGMVRNKVFMMGNREMMIISQMGAMNCQTGVYHISEFTKALLKKRRGFNQTESYPDMIQRSIDTYAEFNKLALTTANAAEYANTVLNLTDLQLRILQALFDKRNAAMPSKEIISAVAMDQKPTIVNKDLDELSGMKLINNDKYGEAKKYKKDINYLITASGIKKVMDYLQYVHGKAKEK